MVSPHRSPIQSQPRLRHRKSIEKLRPDQLDALRRGFAAIKRLRDNRGFWHWAGLHGAPAYDCEHSLRSFDSLFLPWHRAYLYRLELALQTQVPESTLPWWDWPASRATGIPAAYSEQQVDGADNPLAGSDLPPLYTDDEEMAHGLLSSGQAVGDPLWRMPFWPPYDTLLKSSIADVNHIAEGSFAGSIIAALFLRRFVRNAKRFAHLDIFGWVPRDQPGRPKGGEPQAARALFHFFRRELGAS